MRAKLPEIVNNNFFFRLMRNFGVDWKYVIEMEEFFLTERAGYELS